MEEELTKVTKKLHDMEELITLLHLERAEHRKEIQALQLQNTHLEGLTNELVHRVSTIETDATKESNAQRLTR
jgi:hypothetical protein